MKMATRKLTSSQREPFMGQGCPGSCSDQQTPSDPLLGSRKVTPRQKYKGQKRLFKTKRLMERRQWAKAVNP